MLPLLCFGNFTTEFKYKEEAKARHLPEDFPPIPGVFALSKPYEHTVCLISENCPARYVNDAKNVHGATNNIQFLQHDNPRELFHDSMKGLHLFLQAQATRDIEPGEQLFLSYGELFWAMEQKAAINCNYFDNDDIYEVGDDDIPENEDDLQLNHYHMMIKKILHQLSKGH